jgi:hypothetical protein
VALEKVELEAARQHVKTQYVAGLPPEALDGVAHHHARSIGERRASKSA